MKKPSDEEVEQFLEDFFRLSKLGKNITLQDIKKAEKEHYEERLGKHLQKRPKKLYSLDSFSKHV